MSFLGKSMEKDIPSKWTKKQAGVSIYISDKLDAKPQPVRRDKEEHYILIKRKIHRDVIPTTNIYVTNRSL